MSRRFTHCIPKLLKTIFMSSVLISSVHTPFLHPSLPTKLCGWGLLKRNKAQTKRIYEIVKFMIRLRRCRLLPLTYGNPFLETSMTTTNLPFKYRKQSKTNPERSLGIFLLRIWCGTYLYGKSLVTHDTTTTARPT